MGLVFVNGRHSKSNIGQRKSQPATRGGMARDHCTARLYWIKLLSAIYRRISTATTSVCSCTAVLHPIEKTESVKETETPAIPIVRNKRRCQFGLCSGCLSTTCINTVHVLPNRYNVSLVIVGCQCPRNVPVGDSHSVELTRDLSWCQAAFADCFCRSFHVVCRDPSSSG